MNPMDWPPAISARLLEVPQNTLSAHLSVLTRADLVTSERHSRSIVYRANLTTFFRQSPSSCCRTVAAAVRKFALLFSKASSLAVRLRGRRRNPVPDRIHNVLFLRTGNFPRSILAESILRKDGDSRFHAFSAGSQPKGEVNPIALRVLSSLDYPTGGLRSKSWQEFATPDALRHGLRLYGLRARSGGERFSVRPEQPTTAHWGIEDPAAVEGTDLQKEAAFVSALRYMQNRIAPFLALPLGSIDAMAPGTKLHDIGNSEGSTLGRPRVA